jgi:hypothetical protein
MTIRLRPWLGLAAALAGGPAFAQVTLLDEVKPGDCFTYDIALTVDGRMTVDRDGRPDALPLKAAAAHAFAERVEAPDARGGVGTALRYSTTARTGRSPGRSWTSSPSTSTPSAFRPCCRARR